MTFHIVFVKIQSRTGGIVRYLSDISKTQRKGGYIDTAQSLSKGKWLMTLHKNKSENRIFKNNLCVKEKRKECKEANECTMGHFNEIRL